MIPIIRIETLRMILGFSQPPGIIQKKYTILNGSRQIQAAKIGFAFFLC